MSLTAQRQRGELKPLILSEHDAALARAAQRCLMAALDHSRATAIAVIDESRQLRAKSPVLELPPQALRLMAQVLGAMADQRPITILPSATELTTVEAASYLNVSRPFVVKEVDAGRLPHRKVGTHRRIPYEALMAYRERMHVDQRAALQRLSDSAQEHGLE